HNLALRRGYRTPCGNTNSYRAHKCPRSRRRCMGSKSLAAQFAIVVPLIIPAFFLAQAAQKSRTLVINGHPGEVAVMERDSHAYVEIEALARLTNGSLSFNGNQIMLTLLAPDTPAPATTPPPAGFTKDFIRAGIEEMA